MAKANPIRFSTKYQDDESDLVYYGYRYYKAGTGTWVNRDPKKERGGMNLYAFTKNGPINYFDYIGLYGNPLSGPNGAIGPVPVDCPLCLCQNVEVSFYPHNDSYTPSVYYDFGGLRVGDIIRIHWNVIGNPSKRKYYYDETGSTFSLTPPKGDKLTVTGENHEVGQDHSDAQGFNPTDPGTYTLILNWTAQIRCLSSVGAFSVNTSKSASYNITFTWPQTGGPLTYSPN
jgi:RHS repeat-associated protein